MAPEASSTAPEYLSLCEVVPKPGILDDIRDRKFQLYHVNTTTAGLVFVAVGVDDSFQLVAELWFPSASIDRLGLRLLSPIQYLTNELLVGGVNVQMRQYRGERGVSPVNIEVAGPLGTVQSVSVLNAARRVPSTPLPTDRTSKLARSVSS